MPKTVFVNGTVVTPEFLNSLNNPVFVDSPDNDGEIRKIQNSEFSTTPGQLLPEWTAFRDEFKVIPGTGLSVAYTGGRVLLPNNTYATVAPGTATLADNATNYLYLNPDGTVGVGTSLPLVGFPLAQITTAAGAISGAIADLRPRHRILPRVNAIRIFGGSGDQGDFVAVTGTTTLGAGQYYYKNFTVGAAATVILSQATTLNISGDCTIDGTIQIAPIVAGGKGVFGSIAGIYFQRGGGFGGGGLQLDVGAAYDASSSRLGSGGGSGALFSDGSGTGTGANGGAGGSALEVFCAGMIRVSSSGSILAKGGDGGVGTLISGSFLGLSGAGGGSGGLILLSALSGIVVSGTLDVRGGNGGDRAASGGHGGGGGSGGRVALICPSVNTTGASILLAGGSRGANDISITNLGAGSGGSFGGIGGNGVSTAAEPGILSIRNFLPVG